MISPMKVGNITRDDYKEFFIDAVADITKIDETSCCAGSIVYIINTGDVYMLTEEKEWRLM